MPLFQNSNKILSSIRPKDFALEKELQSLIEDNLKTVFNCEFIASEFSTGIKHGGRIDTLALSEENNPVIIEYKKIASSELVNQALYYLSWIQDHKGDFQVAVEKRLGKKREIDWSDIRVICIAPDYKKYDLHAVQVRGANIELWIYRYYENGAFFLEEVSKRSGVTGDFQAESSGKNPIMVEAGKKAAITRKTGVYSYEEHAKNAQGDLRDIVDECRDFIVGLSESIEEVPKKLYVAYKVTQNFVCMEVHREKFYLFLKADSEELKALPRNGRDVRKIGHFGTGDLEITISNVNDFEIAKPYIKKSLEKVGGG